MVRVRVCAYVSVQVCAWCVHRGSVWECVRVCGQTRNANHQPTENEQTGQSAYQVMAATSTLVCFETFKHYLIANHAADVQEIVSQTDPTKHYFITVKYELHSSVRVR